MTNESKEKQSDIFKKRLTANAEDFDSIIVEMLAYINKLEKNNLKKEG